ncbi:MAG: hypothetical protein AAGD96_06825 [Chloroflexota bacterium]
MRRNGNKQIGLGMVICAFLLIGCSGGASPNTDSLVLPTIAATAPQPLPPTNVPPTLAPTNTAVPIPPTETPTAAPTDTPVVSFAATDTPTPTRLPGFLPTNTPTVSAPLETGLGFPGEIGPSEFRVHLVEAVADQTIYAVVRVKPEVDAGILIYEGNVADLAKEEQQSVQDLLISKTPNREADFSGQGFMEVIAYTPKETGDLSLVVTSSAESEGPYRLYVFDKNTSSANIAFNQTVQLDSGQATTVGVTSNGGKPVVAFMNPLAAEVDAQIQIKNSDGAVLTEANYSGGGSYETTFVLPITTTSYQAELTNVGGATGLFEILVLAIQDPF